MNTTISNPQDDVRAKIKQFQTIEAQLIKEWDAGKLQEFQEQWREALGEVLWDDNYQTQRKIYLDQTHDERLADRYENRKSKIAATVKDKSAFMDEYSQYPGGWYEKLSDEQKQIVDSIQAKNPGAIESITTEAIIIVTDKGKFELPLQDTDLLAQYEYTNIPQAFLDKRDQLWLTKHKYYTGTQLGQYYTDTKQDLLSQAEVESIIKLMPSWVDYQYATWWQPMKQFTTLLWFNNQDLTSWADSDGWRWLG